MAKATTGSSFGINSLQVDAAQMLAHGNSEEEVLKACFGICKSSTPAEKAKARKEFHKWCDDPGFQACYRSEVKRCYMPAYAKAVQRIVGQIDSNLPWLANKAANDVITRMAAAMGEDDNTIRVQIEGMPELGTPGE